MHKPALLAAALAVGFVPASAQAADVLIDFEGTGAPNLYLDTVPLTTLYSGLGVTFSSPNGLSGSILNQASNFGVNARSGTDFFGVNTSVGLGSIQTLTFASEVTNFGLYLSGGGAASFTAQFFDSSNNLLDTVNVANASGAYGFLGRAGAFNSVAISASQGLWVADDLSFSTGVAAVPEPGTWAMMLLGFFLTGAAMRGKARNQRLRISYV